MSIDGIQLSNEAIGLPQSASEPVPQARDGVTIGSDPTDSGENTPELVNTSLPQSHVQDFMFEIQHQPHWRREADRAADYYDGNQLTPETVEKLKDRGQPPLITNIIKPTVDTVLGLEAKSRTDWRVRPDDDDECNDDLAEALSVKLKHAEIESRADRAISDAYAAQIKTGLGWVEVAREHDPFKSPYRVRYIHRREIFWDWRAEQPDISDARFLIRRRWLELENAVAMMPQYASLFRMSTNGWTGFDPLVETNTQLVQSWEVERDTRIAVNDWRDSHRLRLCLSEIWYRKWVRGYVMKLANGATYEVDFNNPRHNEAIAAGIAKVSQATFQKVRLAWYAGPHFLYDVPSPYKHNNFPYVPFFGHREDLTNVPYGLIRSMISPQDEVNARKSKMLWSLNSRRTLADSDAVKDHRKAAEEVSRPDAYIVLDANRKPSSKFTVEAGGELATQQFQVMQEAKQEIAEASGIHKSMQGQQSASTSGTAINSLIEQGMNTLAEINDNFTYARRLVGEMLFEMVQQNLSQGPSEVTIGEGKAKKVIPLNMPGPDPDTGKPTIINNVAKVKAKIALDDVPSTPTYRMQQLQMLTEITKALPPNLQGFVIDFVIEATDMPKRHELADRLRQAVGIQTPEAQQQQTNIQQQAAAEQQQLATAEAQAKIRLTNAQADKAQADAQATAEQAGIDGSQTNELQAKHDEEKRQLQEQITLLNQKLTDRQAEIAAQTHADIERAHITAVAGLAASRESNDLQRQQADRQYGLDMAMTKAKIDEIKARAKAAAKPLPKPAAKREPALA